MKAISELRTGFWLFAVLLALCFVLGAWHGVSMASRRATKGWHALTVLRDTQAGATRRKALSGQWPKDVSQLKPLATHLTGDHKNARIGPDLYAVSLFPHAYEYGSPMPLVRFERVSDDGRRLWAWREVYAVSADGTLFMRRSWDLSQLFIIPQILVLALMLGLPVFVCRRRIRDWFRRSAD